VGRGRGDGAVHVADLAEVGGAELGQAGVGELGEHVLPRPHEAAAAATAPGLDQAQLAQLGQRLAEGDRRDVEHRGQIGLGRQLLAVPEEPEGDGAAHPAHDGLAAQRAVVERREDGAPGVTAEQLHARLLSPGSQKCCTSRSRLNR
jgi:hypothetical protein